MTSSIWAPRIVSIDEELRQQLEAQLSFQIMLLEGQGYTYLGPYEASLEFTAALQFTSFNYLPVVLKNTVSLPFTTTGTWEGDDDASFLELSVPNGTLRQDLITKNNPALGAAIVAIYDFTVAEYLGKKVSPFKYGAWGNGVVDDSAAVAAATAELKAAGGGILDCNGLFLVGGIEIDTPYVVVQGRSEKDGFVVKSGTLGIHVKQHWVSFRDLTVSSQGNRTDGLNTRGVLYDKGGVSSTGFTVNMNLTFKNFSGYGMRNINAISVSLLRAYFVSCTIGSDFQRDAGAVLFSTTVFYDNVYVSSCPTGINGQYVYRSEFNVIGEFCGYAMDMFAGDFTLRRCYFENNTIRGVRARNAIVQDLYTYSNNPTLDAVSIEFDVGVVPAADRGFVRMKDYDITAKRLAVLATNGVDPKFLMGHGTTANVGLKYGEATVAISRGRNLINPAAWAPVRLAELIGWSNVNQGFEISGTSGGDLTHGLIQTVTLDITKQYIIEFRYTPVLGTISTLRVGALTVTAGVPFTPPANGANTVFAFGSSAGSGIAFEMYVNTFTIAEVLADVGQVAECNDRLTREKSDRGTQYASAAPVTGRWRVGEKVYHTAPTAGGFIGWVCTASGSPGTWKTFGTISA